MKMIGPFFHTLYVHMYSITQSILFLPYYDPFPPFFPKTQSLQEMFFSHKNILTPYIKSKTRIVFDRGLSHLNIQKIYILHIHIYCIIPSMIRYTVQLHIYSVWFALLACLHSPKSITYCLLAKDFGKAGIF